MPHVYAAAASPLGQAALNLASEGEKTKGPRAVIAVLLMFGILGGGVFMLLQSNFGPKVGYLVTGTAFWGCWLVLSVLWFTGVPGFPMPGPIPDVPESTVRFTGPQGTDSSWNLIDTDDERRDEALPRNAELFQVDPASPIDQGLLAQITAAQTAAGEGIAEHYAKQAGVEQSTIVAGKTYVVEKSEIARKGGRVQWVRLSTKAATPNAAATKEEADLIAKIQPATFDLYFEPGNLPVPTYISMALFLVLFVVHLVLLGLTDTVRASASPRGVPERLVTS